MRCIAIDWSGRAHGAERHIWIAEARDGRLVFLAGGFSREAATDWLMSAAREDPDLVAGLDFAFSFPAWYCATRGWASAPAVWRAIADEGEAVLRDCPDPFWGRPGVRRRLSPERGRRVTEQRDAPSAKSIFQIGGAGAVGTGSLRGMGQLLRLREAGFTIWPFDGAARAPFACEIYPRMMYGATVRKRRRADRLAFLRTHCAEQPADLLQRAAAGEDAFDAAVSALVMSAHGAVLRRLPAEPEFALEGRIWVPPVRALSAPGPGR